MAAIGLVTFWAFLFATFVFVLKKQCPAFCRFFFLPPWCFCLFVFR